MYLRMELLEKGVPESLIQWRRWRRAMRLSQAEAAAMAGLYEGTVRALELGHKKPQRRTLAKLDALRARWTESNWPARPKKLRGKAGQLAKAARAAA